MAKNTTAPAAQSVRPARSAEAKIAGNVPVFLEKHDKHDDTQYVCINGKRALLKKGETIKVSPEVAEVIENARAARRETEAYELANEPKTAK